MAYREPTFNANILTDLLSTYLDQKSKEREKYYKAAEKASTPKYQTVGGNIVRIKQDGSTETVFEGPKKEPKFEDFPLMDEDELPTGITAKAKYIGGDYKEAGLPIGYKKVGAKTQRAPDDEVGDLIKETRSFSRDRIKSLKRLKEGRLSPTDAIYVKQGFLPAKWSEELQGELDYYNKVLGNTRKFLPKDSAGIPTYELFLEKNKNISKETNNISEETNNISEEFGSFWKKDK